MNIAGVKIGSTSIGVKSIGNLVVARFILIELVSFRGRGFFFFFNNPFSFPYLTYQSPEIVPHLRNVRVQANSTRVGVQRITVLVNLIVQYTNGAPKGWVPSVTVDRLLISFVRLGVLALRHVATTKEIPALGIGVVYLSCQYHCEARGLTKTHLR